MYRVHKDSQSWFMCHESVDVLAVGHAWFWWLAAQPLRCCACYILAVYRTPAISWSGLRKENMSLCVDLCSLRGLRRVAAFFPTLLVKGKNQQCGL